MVIDEYYSKTQVPEMEDGMDNRQLESFLRQTGCSKRFRVIAADELNITRRLKPGQLRMTNTDISTGKGYHWVLFFVGKDEHKNKIINYFDPLGECSLDYPNYKQFVSKYDVLISNEGMPVQHDNLSTKSNSCGMHCAFVAHLLCDEPKKYKTLEDVMTVYDISNTENAIQENECLALRYLNERFVTFSPVFNKLKGCKRVDKRKIKK
jgi:hypothetical protein